MGNIFWIPWENRKLRLKQVVVVRKRGKGEEDALGGFGGGGLNSVKSSKVTNRFHSSKGCTCSVIFALGSWIPIVGTLERSLRTPCKSQAASWMRWLSFACCSSLSDNQSMWPPDLNQSKPFGLKKNYKTKQLESINKVSGMPKEDINLTCSLVRPQITSAVLFSQLLAILFFV